MAFIIENLRLKELAIVAELNRPAFEYFVQFVQAAGYPSLQAFVLEGDEAKARAVILRFIQTPLPKGVELFDGIARPYLPQKAKWLLLGWVFRDAPEQRLRPMVASMPGRNTAEKQAYLLNQLRAFAGTIFPEAARWDWTAVSEVVIDRLEGSRRAIKGTLFEAIVRRNLEKIFATKTLKLEIGKTEIRLGGETYDVSVVGSRGQILIPVKTRETMGGGHALLFTRDIHKSIAVAHESGFDCLPVIIAESWAGDLTTLSCKDHVYINRNPNQIAEVEPLLTIELERRLSAFQSIM
ncbi:hypothetical protein SAMN04488003_11160 [Loktanella fryxellensis]|uniref:Uncharacterized protein n=1 Tax=Loktanella fryxellensis TaxID=245187 RepID=A0A1H8ERV0_9RHOB|nr:hypothetical protein [Loktanella fryxellensis]SEN21607.1 hypothetical protein SAMN04488003_11160 [Loktanella fryxellensis]